MKIVDLAALAALVVAGVLIFNRMNYVEPQPSPDPVQPVVVVPWWYPWVYPHYPVCPYRPPHYPVPRPSPHRPHHS